MALNDISFKGESLTHSFKSLVVSLIYLLPHAPDGKRKRFLRQKTILLYMKSMLLELIILRFCDQVYSLALSTVSFSIGGWLITDESCLSRSFSVSLHLFVWRFKPEIDL